MIRKLRRNISRSISIESAESNDFKNVLNESKKVLLGELRTQSSGSNELKRILANMSKPKVHKHGDCVEQNEIDLIAVSPRAKMIVCMIGHDIFIKVIKLAIAANKEKNINPYNYQEQITFMPLYLDYDCVQPKKEAVIPLKQKVFGKVSM